MEEENRYFIGRFMYFSQGNMYFYGENTYLSQRFR